MVPEHVGALGSVLRLDDRVEAGGHRGTVRYIGNVAGTKGEWLGIDWDDSTRGKHNGNHNGVVYFTARNSNSGSFIRPAKITPAISCAEAIRKRYGLIEDNAGVDLHSLAQVQKDIRAKVFQVVGAEKVNKKQSQFSSLQVVSLREQPIHEAGPPNALHLLSPNIRELDLSKTLISSWAAAADIAVQLPHLRLLDLSENRLEIGDSSHFEAFKSLEHLVMARAGLTWCQVLQCCSSIPNLKVLQVPFNNIQTLSIADTDLLPVTSLDLEGNRLHGWSEVNKLGWMSHLASLNLSACSLREVNFPAGAGLTTALFPSLQQLLLNENEIADWASISELDRLPALTELKCLKNPVLEHENFETNYQLIVARIKKLKVLNGQRLTAEERRGAEFDFLKRHGREYLKLSSEPERAEFLRLYPCYQRLVDILGPPEESELKKPPASLKSALIQVELFSPEDPGSVFRKKVPFNMTVQKLTGLVQRIFDTGSEVPRLYCLHSSGEGVEVELDNEMKDLNFFSVEDGSRIAVRW